MFTNYCADQLKTMINYTVSNTSNDLQEILDLQEKNLPIHISKEELAQEGFVTVHHTFEVLEKMNQPYPHIVAKDGAKVVGYTLVMLQTCREFVPVLIPMFNLFDTLSYQGKALKELRYFVMGQVCIDKAYRGQGVFIGLYEEMKKRMLPHFDYIITEIAKRNPRSLRAHEKVGFKVLKEFESNGEDWVVVILEIKNA